MNNVIFNKTVTQFLTIFKNSFIPNLNSTSYLKNRLNSSKNQYSKNN